MIASALRRLFGQEQEVPADLFEGDAHGVLCEEGLTPVALTYLSPPAEDWYAMRKPGLMGVAVPQRLNHCLPAELLKRVACWYFRADLPRAILKGTDVKAWKAARIEQPEAGIWCVYFDGFAP